MSNHYEKEEALTGGNVSSVSRLGNTVRRELKPDSVNTHTLLKHLESKGLHGVPKFLGIDEQGREILSFIEGEAGNYPLQPYMWSDEVLKEIANMLRSYHDAVSDFPIDERWRPLDNTPQPFEVVCHNDFAIYNIIFSDKKPVGVIDFDMAAPGPRLWDIAYAMYTCVPLSRLYYTEAGEAIYYDSLKDAERIKQRIALFFDSYGMEGMESGFLEMVILRVEGLCKTIQRKAKEGDMAFQKMIDEGHYDHYQEELRFIRKHGQEWM
ncbi:phosphotransferase enzyme family protein [Paenibacillus arenosi]|uniref:Aminoglycoside phosphotransferase family protein n=1 Tax=Paenibacillus arenosi TaxID=2774142 RepID=A0ABR9AVH3_9BACL|nr:aminoglycoside phosphotransferase family protein [Paenibacillus arenosi]MBD8498093.1 aminoglycoside phosphotransferase family protein [Paenibacillus arenosi]